MHFSRILSALWIGVALGSPLPSPGKDPVVTVIPLAATETAAIISSATEPASPLSHNSVPSDEETLHIPEIPSTQNLPSQAEIDDAAVIKNGRMRYGVEIETILKMSKDGGSDSAAEIREALRISHQEYLSIDEADPQLNEKRASKYSTATNTIINFLVKEWRTYEPTSQQIKRNHWLADAEGVFLKHKLIDLYKKERSSDSTESWAITYDGTIKPIQQEYEFAFEFVSPIIFIGMKGKEYASGRYPVEFFYSFLQHCGFEIIKSESCSTHVHVSPEGSKTEWTEERVKRVAAASVFFEPAIRSLLPPDRWVNYHALEYRDPTYHGHWAVKGFGESDKGVADAKPAALGVMEKIFAKKSLLQVRNYMNPGLTEGNNPNSFLTSRTWGWNFLNLIVEEDASGRGTVEFRRGGQSLEASEAMGVIELVVGFSLASCLHSPADLEKSFTLMTSSLEEFLYDIPEKPETDGYDKDFRFPELSKMFKTLGHDFDPTSMQLDYSKSPKTVEKVNNPLEWLDGVDLDGMTVEEYLETQRQAEASLSNARNNVH